MRFPLYEDARRGSGQFMKVMFCHKKGHNVQLKQGARVKITPSRRILLQNWILEYYTTCEMYHKYDCYGLVKSTMSYKSYFECIAKY